MVFSQLGSALGNNLDFAGSIGNPTFLQSLTNSLGPFGNTLGNVNNTLGFGKTGLLGSSVDFLNNNSEGLGALGGLYGAYNQQNMANKQYKLQKDAYNFNKMLSQREIDRQNNADKSLANAWSNSSYVK